MMNTTQIEALKTAVRYLANSEHSHFVSEGEPDDHIYRTVMTLNHFLDGDENQADNGADNPTAGSPIGIARDHPSHDEGKTSQGPSVIDRGSKEIETRWAKETIGLVAVELNEAYAQFDTSRDNGLIPTGALCNASRRLEEAMQRLGLTDEIPF